MGIYGEKKCGNYRKSFYGEFLQRKFSGKVLESFAESFTGKI
jgi:hypothetical protein